ncbi:bifunctional enoyl-CoA hydratase/phosphate acetyltransferase [Tropicimonas sp. TH_r6]|uniref:bifunctional enoyl-CoA hydratase/phosphate acetyltransferase n=1 Tax=Tropicimonas sp. TH_r6 TaxID=3082085 RepID=UPI00295502A2|nr:bifunctional enoyl-CoA hydratase/phosphate acetyltransferase [Tropicimonas sp. TH_r6]MDV7142887.1 bifunctional enoyl-CoA hydratase/phosphate acetyltransferase [Tropicimonas sp. TH_r6]
MTKLTNTPWDKLEVGMEAEVRRVCRADDFFVFANITGNMNPKHFPRMKEVEGDAGLHEPVAPAMWVSTLVSSALGNKLPGPGTLYKSHKVEFHERAHDGDELIVKVRLTDKLDNNVARFSCAVDTTEGKHLMDGTVEVYAPLEAMDYDAGDIPGMIVQKHVHFDKMLAEAEPLPPMKTSVVAPETEDSLLGPLLAADHTIIDPILIGDEVKIHAAAKAIGRDISGFELIHEPNHKLAASIGVRLVHEGKAQAVMKGNLHTDDLLGQVVKRDGGLRIGRRLSHVFVMDVPGLTHLLLISDAAINIAPDLETKVDITQNAIDLGHALGLDVPKVGILSAVETVTPKIPSTLDAAAISKMAERGQIKGALVDGPLAMDNAIDIEAARTKGIQSMVAGQAEILIAPNLESANMLAKELTFIAHAEAGGVVIGAKCPVILTSRADDEKARLVSCACAALYAYKKAPV